MKTTFALVLFSFLTSHFALAETCTYDTWDWDTVSRRATNRQRIVKTKTTLTPEETGIIPGCTICQEDQVEVHIKGLPSVRVCKVIQKQIRTALSVAKEEGFHFQSVIGYRVGKSKGAVDASGLRTQFSNHSYGTAIDVNSELNGLYDSCVVFNPACKLLRGGVYRPELQLPGTILSTSPITKAMLSTGLKWGGDLKGKQKDFMHFSLSGN